MIILSSWKEKTPLCDLVLQEVADRWPEFFHSKGKAANADAQGADQGVIGESCSIKLVCASRCKELLEHWSQNLPKWIKIFWRPPACRKTEKSSIKKICWHAF